MPLRQLNAPSSRFSILDCRLDVFLGMPRPHLKDLHGQTLPGFTLIVTHGEPGFIRPPADRPGLLVTRPAAGASSCAGVLTPEA